MLLLSQKRKNMFYMISVHFNCLSAFKFNRALLPITDLKLFAGITPFLGAGLLTETFKLFSISPF